MASIGTPVTYVHQNGQSVPGSIAGEVFQGSVADVLAPELDVDGIVIEERVHYAVFQANTTQPEGAPAKDPNDERSFRYVYED